MIIQQMSDGTFRRKVGDAFSAKKFGKNIKKGTKVMINGEWYPVTEIHSSQKLIKVKGLGGSFQPGHISQFTNK